MARDGAVAGAALCGGATCVILVCLFVVGIPAFIAGIVLVSEFDTNDNDEESIHTAGVICLVIACVMIVAGIITAILTCVFVGKASGNRPAHRGGVVVNTTTATTGYPVSQGQVQYQPQVQGQYPAQPPTYYPQQGQPVTAHQYGGLQNPEYAKY